MSLTSRRKRRVLRAKRSEKKITKRTRNLTPQGAVCGLIYQLNADDQATSVLKALEERMAKANVFYDMMTARRSAENDLISYAVRQPTHELNEPEIKVSHYAYWTPKNSGVIDVEYRDVTPEPRALPSGDVDDQQQG